MFDSTVQMEMERGSRMKLQIWINTFFFVAVLLQVNSSPQDDPKANLIALQEKVEKLIETLEEERESPTVTLELKEMFPFQVTIAIQEYYAEKDYKCLPDQCTGELLNTVKEGIDCVERSHQQYQEGQISFLEHRKEFHSCFEKAKDAVEFVLENLNPDEINCPAEVVEKTFQINVTTSYTKTFNLNIQNGVEVVINKTIQVTRKEEPCRNYPDVFSYDERNQVAVHPVSGILNVNLRTGLETQHIADEPTTPENSRAGHDEKTPTEAVGLEKESPPELAYAYFQHFQNGSDGRHRREPEIRRKKRNLVFKGRQRKATV